jgi:hypothetical protein
MINYREEAIYNSLLIELTKELDRLGRLDLLSSAFKMPILGKLERAQRRQPFDVELTFSKMAL